MKQRFVSIAIVVGLMVIGAVPVAGAPGWVDRIEDVDTVLAVRFDEDFPLASLMRATCDWFQFVQRPDGSGIETAHCTLSSEPVMIPEFQGEPPATAFVHSAGRCQWTSDYWFARNGSIVMAESLRYVVAASGRVSIRAAYPAEPLACG